MNSGGGDVKPKIGIEVKTAVKNSKRALEVFNQPMRLCVSVSKRDKN